MLKTREEIDNDIMRLRQQVFAAMRRKWHIQLAEGRSSKRYKEAVRRVDELNAQIRKLEAEYEKTQAAQ